MPKLGNTVEQCLLVAWHKHKGDAVCAGEVLAEMETDKATFDLTAPRDGTLLEVFFDDGATVPVFTNVCVIGEPGEAIEEYRPQPPVPPVLPVPPVTAGTPATASVGDVRAAEARIGKDAAASPASGGGADPTSAIARSTGGPPAAQPATPAPSIPVSVGQMSPRARRFAAEHGFQPPTAPGSGPGGRILERDVRARLRSAPPTTRAARSLLNSGYELRGAGSGVVGMIRAGDLVPPPVRFSGMRERIAQRMGESLASTAQYTLHASADATELLAFRREIKALPGAPDITVNHLVASARSRPLSRFRRSTRS